MIVLTVDIGNTCITLCFFNKKTILNYKKISVSKMSKKSLLLDIKKNVKDFSNLAVVISSVVPKMTSKLEMLFNKLSIKTVLLKDLRSKIKLNTLIQNKNSIGEDRIVNVFFAKKSFEKSTIIVDFGTATTFDVLDKDGNYAGGIITPGIDISLMSLKKNTAKLPLVRFKKVDNIVGITTEQAIQSGFFWGYICMIKGLIEKIQLEKRTKFKVILTGGNSNFFKGIFGKDVLIDEFFTSKGLNLILTEYSSSY